MPPIVSIITIFLDAAGFLDEAVESVYAQAFEDWELLLIDDGSTDGSTAIARRIADSSDGRVRYLEHDRHANLGMGASRNLGLDHARGRYVAFLDADDVWLPGKLAEQVAILDGQPEAAMVYGLSEYWRSWGGGDGRADDARGRSSADYVHELGVPPRTLLRPPELLRRFFLAQDAAIPGPTSVLVRGYAIERVGGFDPSFRGPYEDQVLYAKLCLRYPVIAVDTVWDRYRLRSDSTSRRDEGTPAAYAERARFLGWLENYLQDSGLGDRALLRGLRRQRWLCRHPRIARATAVAVRAGRAVLRFQVPATLGRGPWFRVPARLLERWLVRLLGALGRGNAPAPGQVRFGDLRRGEPITRSFGFERGTPIDRHYIERFLADHQSDIRGRVLEVADSGYTDRFGGGRVTNVDVLDTSADNPAATIVGDLIDGTGLESDAFDCIVLTQTLQFVYEIEAAVRTLHRILRPGGVVLATMPGISPISRYEADRWGHYWNLTIQSAARLFGRVFGPEQIQLEGHGNVLTAVAFLEGIAAEELEPVELARSDPDYPVIVAVRAVKPTSGQRGTIGDAEATA